MASVPSRWHGSRGIAAGIIRPVEFLVAIDIRLPGDLEDDRREALLKAEFERGASLAEAGILRMVWRVPGKLANRGIWAAPDATALHEALVSLPLWPYMTVEVIASRATPAGRALPRSSGRVRGARVRERLRGPQLAAATDPSARRSLSSENGRSATGATSA